MLAGGPVGGGRTGGDNTGGGSGGVDGGSEGGSEGSDGDDGAVGGSVDSATACSEGNCKGATSMLAGITDSVFTAALARLEIIKRCADASTSTMPIATSTMLATAPRLLCAQLRHELRVSYASPSACSSRLVMTREGATVTARESSPSAVSGSAKDLGGEHDSHEPERSAAAPEQAGSRAPQPLLATC